MTTKSTTTTTRRSYYRRYYEANTTEEVSLNDNSININYNSSNYDGDIDSQYHHHPTNSVICISDDHPYSESYSLNEIEQSPQEQHQKRPQQQAQQLNDKNVAVYSRETYFGNDHFSIFPRRNNNNNNVTNKTSNNVEKETKSTSRRPMGDNNTTSPYHPSIIPSSPPITNHNDTSFTTITNNDGEYYNNSNGPNTTTNNGPERVNSGDIPWDERKQSRKTAAVTDILGSLRASSKQHVGDRQQPQSQQQQHPTAGGGYRSLSNQTISMIKNIKQPLSSKPQFLPPQTTTTPPPEDEETPLWNEVEDERNGQVTGIEYSYVDRRSDIGNRVLQNTTKQVDDDDVVDVENFNPESKRRGRSRTRLKPLVFSKSWRSPSSDSSSKSSLSSSSDSSVVERQVSPSPEGRRVKIVRGRSRTVRPVRRIATFFSNSRKDNVVEGEAESKVMNVSLETKSSTSSSDGDDDNFLPENDERDGGGKRGGSVYLTEDDGGVNVSLYRQQQQQQQQKDDKQTRTHDNDESEEDDEESVSDDDDDKYTRLSFDSRSISSSGSEDDGSDYDEIEAVDDNNEESGGNGGILQAIRSFISDDDDVSQSSQSSHSTRGTELSIPNNANEDTPNKKSVSFATTIDYLLTEESMEVVYDEKEHKKKKKSSSTPSSPVRSLFSLTSPVPPAPSPDRSPKRHQPPQNYRRSPSKLGHALDNTPRYLKEAQDDETKRKKRKRCVNILIIVFLILAILAFISAGVVALVTTDRSRSEVSSASSQNDNSGGDNNGGGFISDGRDKQQQPEGTDDFLKWMNDTSLAPSSSMTITAVESSFRSPTSLPQQNVIETTLHPTEEPTKGRKKRNKPTMMPLTRRPTSRPTPWPTSSPTPDPTPSPTPSPTPDPTPSPTPSPTPDPTPSPTESPTPNPTPPPTTTPTPPPPLTFYVMGDIPYTPLEQTKLLSDITSLPHTPHSFLVHVGDIMSAKTSLCIASNYQDVRNILLQSPIPVFILPGDNDWNDCPDPNQAFRYWMQNFEAFEEEWGVNYSDRMNVRRENFAFVKNDILFVGVNLVGGLIHDDDEWKERHRQNMAWIRRQYDNHHSASSSLLLSVVVFGHAMPGRKKHEDFFPRLINWSESVGVDVLYVYGDGHEYGVSDMGGRVTGVEVDMGRNAPPLEIMVKIEEEEEERMEDERGGGRGGRGGRGEKTVEFVIDRRL